MYFQSQFCNWSCHFYGLSVKELFVPKCGFFQMLFSVGQKRWFQPLHLRRRLSVARVTRRLCEKIAQDVAKPIFLSKLMHTYVIYTLGKSRPNLWNIFCHFSKTCQKQTIAHWAKIRPIRSPWLWSTCDVIIVKNASLSFPLPLSLPLSLSFSLSIVCCATNIIIATNICNRIKVCTILQSIYKLNIVQFLNCFAEPQNKCLLLLQSIKLPPRWTMCVRIFCKFVGGISWARHQGCQIFPGTTHQNGGKSIPNDNKI
jgi:hypothetical protein